MRDRIALLVDGKKIEHFESYSIESDLYVAADGFTMEMHRPGFNVKGGSHCELYVNDELEMTGLIDTPIPSFNKEGEKLKIQGRDLMGLLVDSHVEEFTGLKGQTLKTLAERLLKTVPFINRKNIIYQENIVGKLKKRHRNTGGIEILDTPQAFTQIEPGMSIFDALSEYAASRGLLFFALPDGTFVFGKPVEKGEPEYSIIVRRNGQVSNVLEGTKYEDFSKRYSKVTVVGQRQGTDLDGMDTSRSTPPRAIVEDPTFPFYKPFVAKNNNDYQSPKQHARMILDKQRHDGFQLYYKLSGHSQNGKNWKINQLCRVYDEVNEVDGVFVIYNRVLELNKKDGMVTWLKLGLPGVSA